MRKDRLISQWRILTWVWIVGILTGPTAAAPHDPSEEVLRLNGADFGITADGITDDGPAVAQMVQAARAAGKMAVISFPQGKKILIRTCPTRYVFELDAVSDLTIEGGGCQFLLDPFLRFLTMKNSRRVTVRNLKVDFVPLPFADGRVSNCFADKGYIDVTLNNCDVDRVCGGPTRQDGEQAFFSMLWNPGPYSLVSTHYWTDKIEKSGAGTVRVWAGNRFHDYQAIEPGITRISLPVPGAAHRYGPGPCLAIQQNNEVLFEDVELWSAPWFGFYVFNNEGPITFRRVHIRPRPGSGRLMSIWRDGFHVKGNRGPLLWEDCIVKGMNDDAFNISTHCREIQKMIAPDRIILRQRYPLAPIPWHVGEEMVAVDSKGRHLLGRAVVKKIQSQPRTLDSRPAAPLLIVTLDKPIENSKPGDRVWQPQSANPNTVLRRCRIEMSCRMQSPVTLQDCEVRGLLWFCSEQIEGPFPSPVTVKQCRLYPGRGNRNFAVVVSGEPQNDFGQGLISPRAISDISFIDNIIYGGFSLKGTQDGRIIGNRFSSRAAQVILRQNIHLTTRNNVDALDHTFLERH